MDVMAALVFFSVATDYNRRIARMAIVDMIEILNFWMPTLAGWAVLLSPAPPINIFIVKI